MKKSIFNTLLLAGLLILSGCAGEDLSPAQHGNSDGSVTTTDTSVSAVSVSSLSNAAQTWYLENDLVENYTAAQTVYISFSGTSASITADNETVTPDSNGITVWTDSSSKTINATLLSEEDAALLSETDPEAPGLIVEYKGTQIINYVLSGNFSGTFKLKNKKADAIVTLNGVSITSTQSGPAMHFTAEEKRTFICVNAGTSNTLTDSRCYTDPASETTSAALYNSKKGSVYAKGPLILTGETSSSTGGTLTVINTGYKHAVYSADYIRISGITLNVSTEENSRDCIRALCAVIIDSGKITLNGNGTIEDDESAGIRVDGEDADDDEQTVSYAAGTGFIIINGGTITGTTTAKGITAHWKSAETAIGTFTDDDTVSVLQSENLFTSDTVLSAATTPVPFVIINSGVLSITTTLEPYENNDGTSCSPEGIESKGDLIINGGTLELNCTDDCINAGGAITINDGYIYAYSSDNDAVDSNDSTNGITINGGVIVASGTANAECALDADNCKIKINGGWVCGIGTENYTAGSSSSEQYIMEIGSSYYSAGSNFAVINSSGNPVFAYKVPSSGGKIMILSSPDISTGTYTLYTGGTVTESDSGIFHGLYIEPAAYTAGTSKTTVTVSSKVTTKSTTTNQGSQGDHSPGGR